MKIGLLIKNFRLKNGIKQEVLAKQLHITKACLSMYENGKREVSFHTILNILKILSRYKDNELTNQIIFYINEFVSTEKYYIKGDIDMKLELLEKQIDINVGHGFIMSDIVVKSGDEVHIFYCNNTFGYYHFKGNHTKMLEYILSDSILIDTCGVKATDYLSLAMNCSDLIDTELYEIVEFLDEFHVYEDDEFNAEWFLNDKINQFFGKKCTF